MDILISVIAWVILHQDQIVALLTALVTVASIVANMVDPDHPNKWVARASQFVTLLALNLKRKGK